MIVDVDVELVEAQLLALSRASSAMLIHSDRGEDQLMVELAGAVASSAHALIMMFDAQESIDSADGVPASKPDTDDPETCGHSMYFELPGQMMCRTCGASRTAEGWVVI